MPIVYYPARLTRDDDGSFMFQAVDIPQALSAGPTLEAALAHGTEALQLAVESWDAKDGPLPSPSPLSAEMEIDNGVACIVQLVPVALSEPTVKINVTMPGDLVKRIDAVAGNYGRSGFIADACREKLERAAVPVFDLIDNRLVPRGVTASEVPVTNSKAGRLAVNVPRGGDTAVFTATATGRDVAIGLAGPKTKGNLKNLSSARSTREASLTRALSGQGKVK